jgi:hypothetical protein
MQAAQHGMAQHQQRRLLQQSVMHVGNWVLIVSKHQSQMVAKAR